MKKFNVIRSVHVTETVEVMAETAEQAYDLAQGEFFAPDEPSDKVDVDRDWVGTEVFEEGDDENAKYTVDG